MLLLFQLSGNIEGDNVHNITNQMITQSLNADEKVSQCTQYGIVYTYIVLQI